ncbi:NAD(P)-dependent oxidoreductase [Actinomadura sp. KC216]|uniref:NAD-dependent epimerase/dehydratase family protein n=1 Tax=Actinomadura sp. KC216 TaxID=2530370 RepID=UPI00104CB21D|nr:NAD(P)-dependent oxidoreductase [Actinomadura sp. KC216]TDB90163.1 NAD(P)-dependent oxidoreductase [Actinomadura sp. KC216]
MRYAVTGGDGFIGRYAIQHLRDLGHEAFSIDRASGIDIMEDKLEPALRGTEGVIHLAGILGTEELFDSVEAAIDVNIKGTYRILEACRNNGTRFVGITMPQVWSNVYQATKRCGQELSYAWNTNFGVPVSHVRAFNAFGPGQKHYGVQKIIPTFAVRAWSGQPIPIWGDGNQTLDLVHSADLGRMLVDALAFGDREVFDGGTGLALTVNEVAERVLAVTGSKAGVEYLPMRKGETATTDLVAKGEGWDLLGWHPEFREDELERTIVHYRQFAEA